MQWIIYNSRATLTLKSGDIIDYEKLKHTDGYIVSLNGEVQHFFYAKAEAKIKAYELTRKILLQQKQKIQDELNELETLYDNETWG